MSKESMKRTATLIMALSGVSLLACSMATPVSAAIECKGPLQYNSVVKGWIDSSYCGDNFIAAIARASGMQVTGSEIRRNPSIKEEVCRFAGSDIRIQDLCAGHLPEGQNGGGRS